MAHHDSRLQVGRGGGGALLAGAVAAGFLLTLVLFRSFSHALLFCVALAAFSMPGLPVARRWFGGIEAWLAGIALGFLASSLLASILHRLELSSPAAVLLSPLLLFAATRKLSKKSELRSPSSKLGALALLWLFVIAVLALPFAKVGSVVSEGVAFRAYFSADLMTHLSVVAELGKGTFPLENPFYAGEPLGYYWLFFTFPAAVARFTSNQATLLAMYAWGSLLFSGLLFSAMREIGLTPRKACLASATVLGAASYDGLAALSWSFLGSDRWTEMNVDAFSRWVFSLTSLDGLHRALLYTPQHLFSYSLLLVLILLVLRGEPRSREGSVLCGALLGGMAGTSIVTAMLAGPWLVLVLWRRRHETKRFWPDAVGTTLVALSFLAGFVLLGFFGGAGEALTWRLPRWGELVTIPLIDAGALLGLALLASRQKTPGRWELSLLAALALVAVLFLDLRGYEGVWMAWRAGSVFLLVLGLLAAPAFERLRPAHAVLLAPAALTLVLDVYNAQDVSNRAMSPGGFPWTTVVSHDEMEALSFIRAETPMDAVVQWDVRAREPGEWALIPAIAERRMSVGFPIFLLDLRKYRVRERRHVRPIFLSGDASEAHRLAERLGIDYLVLGPTEIRVRGDRVRALFEDERHFRPVLENGSVTVLEVVAR